jgi:hypothetical protein
MVYLEPAEKTPLAPQSVILSPSIRFDWTSHDQHRHDYELLIQLSNLGDQTVREYQVEVEMPSLALEETKLAGEVVARQTTSHRYFQFGPEAGPSKAIYPGQAFTLRIPYHFNHEIYSSLDELRRERLVVRVRVYANGMAARALEMHLRDLHNF